MIYHIISECSKFVQKEYRARHDWELGKKLKFELTNKWYMHKPDTSGSSDLGQTTRPSDSRLPIPRKKKKRKKRKEKRTCGTEDFAIPADQKVKIKAKREVST